MTQPQPRPGLSDQTLVGQQRLLGTQNAQKAVDQFERALNGLTSRIQSIGMGGAVNKVSDMSRQVGTARRVWSAGMADIVQGPTKSGAYRLPWGKVGGDVTFGGGQNHSNVQAALQTVAGGMNRGGVLLSTPGAQGTPVPVQSAGKPNGGGSTFGGGSSQAPGKPNGGSGGGAPPLDLSIGKGALGAVAGGFSYLKGMSAYMIDQGAAADYAIRQQAQFQGVSSGSSYRSAYSRNGFNRIASGHDDLGGAMMTANYVNGGNIGQRQQFERSAVTMGALNPTVSATQLAQSQASMYSARGFIGSAALGMPSIGQGGRRMTPEEAARAIVERTGMRGGITGKSLQTGLRQGYGLDTSIQTYAKMTGTDPGIMRSYLQTTATVMRGSGGDMKSAQRLISDFANGDEKTSSRARTQLEKYEIDKDILSNLRKTSAAGRENEAKVMREFTEALNKITPYLTKFLNLIGKFLDGPAGKVLGYGAAGAGAVGSAMAAPTGLLGAALGAMGGGSALGGISGAVIGSMGGGQQQNREGETGKGGASQASPPGGSSFIKTAMQAIGTPYVWGGSTPGRGIDCSGLTSWAYKKVTGKSLPHRATLQWQMASPVPANKAVPGDFVFFDGKNKGYKHHVGIYMGGGKILHAPTTGQKVKIEKIWNESHVFGRLPGTGGGAVAMGGGSGPTQNDGAGDGPGGDTGAPSSRTGSVGGGSALGNRYGSINELDALMQAMSGGGGSGQPAGGHTAPTGGGGGQAESPVGSSQGGSAPSGSPKDIGRKLAAKYGWDKGTQWDSLEQLWEGESNWNPKASNPSSGAHGIPQALPGNKMASAGKDWKTNPATQITWGLGYIKSRYGSPAKAYSTWKSRSPHWYDNGAWEIKQDEHAVVHKGEMVLDKQKATAVRQALLSSVGKPTGGSGGGLTLHFDANSVVIQGSMDTDSAREAARTFVQAIADDTRIQKIAAGL